MFIFRRFCYIFRSQASKDGISADSTKLDAIKNFARPKTLKDLRGFLGLCSYYRKFVARFAQIASPLTDLTKGINGKGKNIIIPWLEAHDVAFNELKVTMCYEVVLQFPDWEKPYTLHMDASDYAIGGVLSQTDSFRKLRPVTFFSRRLTMLSKITIRSAARPWQ